ncbi:MAG: 30S ribosomal protein S20 [Chlamydiota bacterium]
MATKEAPKKKVKRPTAEKRMVQNEKRRLINKAFKSRIRTSVRIFEESLQSGDEQKVQESLNAVYSMLDKSIKRNIYKANKASRLKARFAAKAAA